MTIYNVNLGLGLASLGIEYVQTFRAKLFRRINQTSQFIFTDMFWQDDLATLAENIGFTLDEVIWFYSFLQPKTS